MAIYYGDANGKAQEVIVVGKPGPQGPAGPQGVPGPQGPAGRGVPTGGTAGQVLTKKTASDYDAEWETVPSKRTCRFVVGTSTAGWTEADCDYLCDGTADDVEINAAIQALPATGGEIVILDGTYHITTTIRMNKDNVTLAGNGAATILKCNLSNSDRTNGVITVTSVNGGCIIRDLCIKGYGKSQGELQSYKGIEVESPNNVVSGNICLDNSSAGISFTNSNGNIITGNKCLNNGVGGGNGSGLAISGSNNLISGNICSGNASDGIGVSAGNGNIITENRCLNNSIGIRLGSDSSNVTGNICSNSRQYGIMITSDNNSVAGNNCTQNGYGIYVDGSKNAVTGNRCFQNSRYDIDIVESNNSIVGNVCVESADMSIFGESMSANNLIVGNNIMGKNYVDNGTNNTWANNKYQ